MIFKHNEHFVGGGGDSVVKSVTVVPGIPRGGIHIKCTQEDEQRADSGSTMQEIQPEKFGEWVQ